MLENMRDACGIRGIGFETDREDIIIIFACYVQVVRAGLVVLEVQRGQLQLGDMLSSLESEAIELRSCLREF